jgi:hypothetical protein
MSDERSPEPPSELAIKINFDVPHSARVWNYWMGGKDNYEVDRAAGDAFVAVYPDIVTVAKQSRRFLIRAVRFLAGEAGMRQFLDIGTGLPTMQNTHEVASRSRPNPGSFTSITTRWCWRTPARCCTTPPLKA